MTIDIGIMTLTPGRCTMQIKDFMEITQYRITEGSEYLWECYGPNAYALDSWNGDNDNGYTITMVFDTQTQEVYQTEAWDYKTHRTYRWINPAYKEAIEKEAEARGVNHKEALEEDLQFTDLDVEADFIEKAIAIVRGEEYDTRIQVELTLPDDALLQLTMLAHERDVTMNKMIEIILQQEIDRRKEKKDE